MATNLLRDSQIRALGLRLKPDGSPISEYLVADGAHQGGLGGLYLVVRLDSRGNPARRWAYLYTVPGTSRRARFWLGTYPAVGLADARAAAAGCRESLKHGIDPRRARDQAKEEATRVREGTFKALADAWLADSAPAWSPARLAAVRGVLNRYAMPTLGDRPVTEIGPVEIARVVAVPIRQGKSDVPRRVRSAIRAVFDHAQDHGLLPVGRNFMDGNRRIGGRSRVATGHYPAIIDLEGFRNLLLAIDGFSKGNFISGSLLRLFPLLAQRPSQVVAMGWEDIDLDAMQWRVPAEKRKLSQLKKHTAPPFIVPLPRQAVAILTELAVLFGCRGFVFPGREEGRHLTREALGYSLRSLGYRTSGPSGPMAHSLHGFRASFLTLSQEVFGASVAPIADRHLGHVPKIAGAASHLGEAYNRAMLTNERAALVQKWADFLDLLKAQGVAAALDFSRKFAAGA